MGTLLVGAILAAIVALIVWGMVRDKKQGKPCGGCGAGCSSCGAGCGSHGQCSSEDPFAADRAGAQAPLDPNAKYVLKKLH